MSIIKQKDCNKFCVSVVYSIKEQQKEESKKRKD